MFAVWKIMLLLVQLNDVLGVVFFCFCHEGPLCRHVLTGMIISKTMSKYNIISIGSCQLSGLSRYGTGITVAYFSIEMNGDWK